MVAGAFASFVVLPGFVLCVVYHAETRRLRLVLKDVVARAEQRFVSFVIRTHNPLPLFVRRLIRTFGSEGFVCPLFTFFP